MEVVAQTAFEVRQMKLPFFMYGIEGLLICIPNMVYFIAIFRTYRLREKYGIMGMEFFTDGIMGLGVMMAGGVRLFRIYFSDIEAPFSRRICMIIPYNVILAWSDPMTAISMLMVSTDRLISIVRPVKYYKNMAKIQKYLALFGNLSVIPLIFGSSVCSFRNNVVLRGICWTAETRCPIFNQLYYGVRASAAALSVVLFIITFFIVRRHMKRFNKSQNWASAAMVDKRQLRFTTTAGFSCFATVGLYVLPMVVAFFESNQEEGSSDGVVVVTILISILNSIPKMIIVAWRSPDIRQSVVDLMPYWKSKRSSVVAFDAHKFAKEGRNTISGNRKPAPK